MHMESGKVRILITYSLFIHGRWIINNNLSITKLHSLLESFVREFRNRDGGRTVLLGISYYV